MALDHVRYAQVWEDSSLLVAGLEITPDDDVLSVCSAGCNVLALLLAGPRSVTAVDMNPAQAALLELKLSAARTLNYDEFVSLLGVRSRYDAEALYRSAVRPRLGQASRAFWDAHVVDIRAGVIRCGRLERFIATFRDLHLPRLWPADLCDRLFGADSVEEQASIFYREALTAEFQQAFRLYFGQQNVAASGRDPAQFAYVQHGDVGAYFLERFTYACTQLPLRGNHYVEMFLTGRYRDLGAAPDYLTPAGFEALGKLVDRVEVVVGELESFIGSRPTGTYSKANLSDIFEYMSPEAYGHMLACLARSFRPGGRLAYWNLLVPRSCPPVLSSLLRPRADLAEALYARDRAWFYSAFNLDEVVQ